MIHFLVRVIAKHTVSSVGQRAQLKQLFSPTITSWRFAASFQGTSRLPSGFM